MNNNTDTSQSPVPAGGPQYKSIFLLPMDCSQAEFAAAWLGNKGQFNPVNYAKIFDALVVYLQRINGMNRTSAEDLARQKYRTLWDRVQLLASIPQAQMANALPQPVTVESGGKSITIANAQERQEFIDQLVTEYAQSGVNPESAFSFIEKRFPALFAGVRHPKIVMPKRH